MGEIMERKIKVLIVDDIPSLCYKYEKIICQSEELEVVGVANNGYEAVMKVAISKPDVVLMDIEMENRLAGIVATRQILEQFPDIKIVILTVYQEDDMVYAAFQAGACDYIQKTATPSVMINCIKDAYKGNSMIRPHVAKQLRKEFKRIKNKEESFIYSLYLMQLLTDTERNILYELDKGKNSKEICEERYIEANTMKTHLRNIVKKLECKSIQDAVNMVGNSGFFYYLDKMRELNEKNK